MLIAVRKSQAYHLQDWTSDDTSLWVKLVFPSGAAPLIIGTCYMPPQGSHNLRMEDAPSRFGRLAAHFLAAQGEGLVLLAGDFNARVGHLELPVCAMRAGAADSIVNTHGKQLISLCTSTGALLCTGWTPGDEAAPFSFRHHNGGCSRIDHVLISTQLRDAMQSCAINQSRTESDHSPIECQLQFNIGVVCATVCNGVNLPKRHWNADCRNKYCDALQAPECVTELQAASQAASDADITSAFHHLFCGVELAADASDMPARRMPQKKRAALHQPFFDAQCQALKQAVRRTRDPAARKQLERQYHSLVRSKRRAYRLGRLRAFITEQYTQPRRFWKQLRSQHVPLPVCLQNVQDWEAYLAQLANVGQVAVDAEPPHAAYPQQLVQPAKCLNNPISEEEVLDGLQRLHNGRAKGQQGLPSELLRYAKLIPEEGKPAPVNVLAPVLTAVLNAAFQSGSIPPDINGGLVTPVFKKGDPLDTGNYRPIAVTEPIMRLYAGILNARVVSFTENNDLRAHTQTGFRPGLATQHNLFALQHMIDEAQGNGKQLYTCFLDLKGAYDRVQRPLLWQVLQRLGIHGVMLRAIQSLYEDSGLTIHINGRRGQTFQSVTGVKQGCPMSPTLFGLYMDGLHHYLMSIDIPDVPMLSSGIVLPNLDYADDTALMASSAHGLQHLINDVSAFCNLMGMIISVVKTKILVFNARYPGPYQWLCNGEQLEVVSTFKYLGLTFHAEHDLQPTFLALKQKMFASWALLKRQYGRLQCLSSVGLMFRLCTSVVQSTACYGCEVWGAATFAPKEREDLVKGYLQILREITGVRTSTPTAILLAELGLQALSDEWLLRAAKFWNNLAALPPENVHRCMALDSCKSAIGPRNRRKNWAGSMYRDVINTGYQLAIRLDDMHAIDITALHHFITQRRDAVWEGLDVCPRTCPSAGARLCTYAAWFARPPHKHARSLLDLPLSSRCTHVCKLCSGFEWVCTVSPRMKAPGIECLGMRGYVSFAIWGHCVMRSMWYLNALLYRVYAMSMPLCFQTCVQ